MFRNIAHNFRKPKGFWGSVVLNRMNKSHDQVTKWALSQIDIRKEDVVLDAGCGGGNAIRLMAQKSGRVFGVDYSELSVKKAGQLNRQKIAEGKVEIVVASVEQLPFPAGRFDLVTAFETIYFWPDWPQNFREVRRVLKPGGRFLVVCEIMRDEQKNRELEQKIGMKVPSVEQLRRLMEEAGFSPLEVHEKEDRSWKDVCMIGTAE